MHFPMFIFLFCCKTEVSIWDICAKEGSKTPALFSAEVVNNNKKIHLKILFVFSYETHCDCITVKFAIRSTSFPNSEQ